MTIRQRDGSTVPTIHLQGIGPAPAKPACEFVAGDVTRWNNDAHGYEVVGIEKASAQFLLFKLRNRDPRSDRKQVWERRIKADRLVAYFPKEG